MAKRHVTLSRAERETPAGRELIILLTELSADGNVSREEMVRLRAWLEVDRGVEFPALSFLHETIEQISSDGEVTEDELDRLAAAIERVLPKEIRLAAAATRKHARKTRRIAERDSRRQAMSAARAEMRAVKAAARSRPRVLYRTECAVRGAFRSEERRESCELLVEGDTVILEREPDNPRDANAVLVLGDDDCELGYLPREKAQDIAPLLDAGAEAEAIVARLWETPAGQTVPILRVKVRRGDADTSKSIGSSDAVSPPLAAKLSQPNRTARSATERPGCGCGTAVFLFLLLVLVLKLAGVGGG